MISATRRNLFGALASLVMLASGVVARAQAAAVTEVTENEGEYRRTIAGALGEFQLGHFAEARALFERAHQLSPNARTLRGMAFADFEGQHYALALSEIEAALADPRKPLDVDQRREAEELLARVRVLVGTEEVPVAPPEPVLAPIARDADRGLSGQRSAALVVAGVGVAAVIVGSIFGVRSIVEHNESDEFCSGAGSCRDARGVAAMDDARSAGNIATAAWIVGGLGLAGAGILWFTAPERAAAATNRTRVAVGLAALQLETRW